MKKGIVILLLLLFPALATASGGAASPDELLSLYRQYIQQQDLAGLRSLVYLDGTEGDSLLTWVDFQQKIFSKQVTEISLSRLPEKEVDRLLAGEVKSIKWHIVPMLKPFGRIEVRYVLQDLGQIEVRTTSTAASFLVGETGGRCYIVLSKWVAVEDPDLKRLDKYFSAARHSGSGQVVDLPALRDETVEGIFQQLRTSLDGELDLYKLVLLDAARLRLLRNEYFARRGYPFQSPDLVDYYAGLGYPADNPKPVLTVQEQANVDRIVPIEFAKKPENAAEIPWGDRYLQTVGAPLDGEKSVYLRYLPPSVDPFAKDLTRWSETTQQVEFVQTGRTITLTSRYSPWGGMNDVKPTAKIKSEYEMISVWEDPGLVVVRKQHDEPPYNMYTSPEILGAYDLAGNLLFTGGKFPGELALDRDEKIFIAYADDGCCGVTDINVSLSTLNGEPLLDYHHICGFANFVTDPASDLHLLLVGEQAVNGDCETGSEAFVNRIVSYGQGRVLFDVEIAGALRSLSGGGKASIVVQISPRHFLLRSRSGEQLVTLAESVPFRFQGQVVADKSTRQ